jgi:hypothetical protein
MYQPSFPLVLVGKIPRKYQLTPTKNTKSLNNSTNFPLIALAEKVSFLLGNWGFKEIAHSVALAMVYNNFLLEVGLYGTPFAWSYSNFGHLSTKSTWFQNLWLLADTYKASILIQEEDLMEGICEDDWPLMSEFYWLGYRGKELIALNTARFFWNLIHVSDIVQCDGYSLRIHLRNWCYTLSHTRSQQCPTSGYGKKQSAYCVVERYTCPINWADF